MSFEPCQPSVELFQQFNGAVDLPLDAENDKRQDKPEYCQKKADDGQHHHEAAEDLHASSPMNINYPTPEV
ncbi:MAG TPA: hypothetical protein VIU41_01115 [Geobacteraceae bacterium]